MPSCAFVYKTHIYVCVFYSSNRKEGCLSSPFLPLGTGSTNTATASTYQRAWRMGGPSSTRGGGKAWERSGGLRWRASNLESDVGGEIILSFNQRSEDDNAHNRNQRN